MKDNDQNIPNSKLFFRGKSKNQSSKNLSETERLAHKSALFASPPFRVPQQSNITSILNQITTTKAIYRPFNLVSERKNSPITAGYMNLAPEIQQKMVMKGKDLRECHDYREVPIEKKDQVFMKDIDKCLDYFDGSNAQDLSLAPGPQSPRTSQGTTQRRKQGIVDRRKHCTSLHEFEKGKSLGDSEFRRINDEWIQQHKRKEKILLNEINCHKAKESEYIKKISFYESKLGHMMGLMKARKRKNKDLKCAFLREQILKDNALGLIRNILEK